MIDAAEYDGTSITHEERCRTAFLSIPFPDRLLCVNAYFSKIWNQCVSERIAENRDEVIVGDLVRDGSDDEDIENTGKRRKSYKVVDENDIRAKRYKMSDVLIPLPGSKSIYPTHRIGTFMKTFLQYESVWKHGFQIEKSIDREDLHQIFGAYRPIVSIPMESRLDFQAIQFQNAGMQIFAHWRNHKKSLIFRFDETQDKIVRELARSVESREITARSMNGFKEQLSTNFFVLDNDDDHVEDEKKKYVAMCFRFALRPGTYATSMLREIQKTETHTKNRTKRHIVFDDDNDHDGDLKKRRLGEV